mgnify:CR=1 FL=1
MSTHNNTLEAKFNTLSHLPVKIKYLLSQGHFKECKAKLIEEIVIMLRRGHYHALDGFSKDPKNDLYHILSLFASTQVQELAVDVLNGKYYEDTPILNWQYNVYTYRKLPQVEKVKCSYCLEYIDPDLEVIDGKGSKGFTIMHSHCSHEVRLLDMLYSKVLLN